MTDIVTIQDSLLPGLNKCAVWHPTAGLIVSQMTMMLPSNVATLDEERNNRHYHLPRKLHDDSIYLAFYPKRLPISPLVDCLILSPDELYDLICPIQNSEDESGRLDFILKSTVRRQWTVLEDTLVSIFETLIHEHPKKKEFPPINWPHLPQHWGYRNSHEDRNTAFACVKRSHRAFTALTACVSFALSLWLSKSEYFRFDRAWTTLSSRPDPIPRAYLGLLEQSLICNFDGGFRAGGFLNPYSTKWGPFMEYFARARVPFWFIWGPASSHNSATLDPGFKKNYLPPPEVVRDACKRDVQYSNNPLPVSDMPPDTSVIPSLPGQVAAPAAQTSAPPQAERGSWQHAGESWESFKERMEEVRERKLQRETPAERQSRLAKKANAERSGPSKSSSVFTWERDSEHPTFYRRTRVSRHNNEARSVYHDVYPHQRFYWDHCDQWDLVSHVTAPPGVAAPQPYEEGSDDEDWDGEVVAPVVETDRGPGLGVVNMGNAVAELLEQVANDAIANIDPVGLVGVAITPLRAYIINRHGYRYNPGRSEYHSAYHSSNRYGIEKVDKVKRALLYSSFDTTGEVDSGSLCDFYNTLVNQDVEYNHLPLIWDIGDDLNIRQWRVKVLRIPVDKATVYILRPRPNSNDISLWNVAVRSATAVLLARRMNWDTMLEIARGFLECGIPFRTVVETSTPPSAYNPQQPRGLGLRPIGHPFTMSDYHEYKARRYEILASPLGRAIRLRGGLVGRIASEVVPEARVLDGPFLRDEIVAKNGGTYFVDDHVSADALDCITGVYLIKSLATPPVITQLSYWPKHATFMNSGLCGDQWTPNAETWYTNRSNKLEDGSAKLNTAYEWKSNVKFHKADTRKWISGSEKLAADYLHYSRRA